MIIIFFDDNLTIEIIDIFHIKRQDGKTYVEKRPFHILTKRISGCTDMSFESDNFWVTPDKLLYIPANTPYSRQSSDTENLVAIHFNILSTNLFLPMLIDVDDMAVNRIFEEMYKIWSGKKRGYKYKCTAMLYDFLSSVIIEKNRSKEYYKLEKSIIYMEKNLNDRLYADKLAQMCNLCETQYRKLFKKEFGISPMKYANKLRINRAVSMLASGYYSMAEIAEMCGFADQKYFNKIFKSETGKSPSEYKKDYSKI